MPVLYLRDVKSYRVQQTTRMFCREMEEIGRMWEAEWLTDSEYAALSHHLVTNLDRETES